MSLQTLLIRRLQFVLLAAVVLLASAALLTAKNSLPVENKILPVWPSPPDPARVAFVQSIIQPSDLGIKVSGIKRFANWVSGAQKGNEPFVKPFGISVDDAGNICLTDTAANAVGYYDATHKRWQRWTSIGKLRFISPVAVAKKGNVIYVVDSELASVIAFDLDGKLKFQITQPLQRPSGLVISGGHLCVVDSQQHAVLMFDLNGKFLSRFGKRGLNDGDLNYPSHITADAAGNLYVTDSMNCRIEVFDATGKFFSQIGSMGDSPGHFSRPKGTAIDKWGHIYVIDALFANIQIFDNTGKLLLNVGTGGSGPGEFWLPNGIAITANDQIYVTDSYNRRIQVFKFLGGK